MRDEATNQVAGEQPASTSAHPEVDLSFEVVLLGLLAVYTLLFGGWLFPIINGQVGYNRDSAYGVFLLVIALQAVTLGKTPVGERPRNWAVMISGIAIAAIGVLACFIPGVFSELAGLLVGVVLTGAAIFAIQMLMPSARQEWTKYRGLPLRVIVNALVTYLLLFPLGLITLWPGRVDDHVTAVLLLASGICLGMLAIGVHRVRTLRQVPTTPPDAAGRPQSPWLLQESSLTPAMTTLVLTGVALLLLAVMLVPVLLGLLPFSPDGQLGALMVIMAVQIVALGDTPVGHYRRSLPLMVLGVVWAVLGITSSIVPGLLTASLQIILGLGNLLGGVLGLGRLLASMRTAGAGDGGGTGDGGGAAPTPPLLKRLGVVVLVMNVLAILFGLSMLLPGLIPPLAIPVILLLNGTAMLVLVALQIKLARLASA